MSQSANGDTTYYLQDKQNPTGYAKAIEDRTDTGSNGSIDATTSYILGLQVIGQADAAATYYLLLDGHGSTAALTNTGGTIVEEYAYSAFGEAIGFDANTAKTNWLFGGDGLWDPKTRKGVERERGSGLLLTGLDVLFRLLFRWPPGVAQAGLQRQRPGRCGLPLSVAIGLSAIDASS